ncbi:MAG: cellulase family glycosylhydrolase [Bryobacteraceae bacterium]
MFVERNGTRLVLGADPFFAEGFNCYFLAFCSDAVRRTTLRTAKELGANTVRSWAFLDSAAPHTGQVCFQYRTGDKIRQQDGPDGLGRLDQLISAAEEMELKLILPLVNYWGDFGGVPMYLDWLGVSREDPSEFFRSERARAAFKSWIDHLLSRRNILTGRLYCEEPAILAWELANEPRCFGERGREVLSDWFGQMSEFLKDRDSNHLLATGDEGFFHRNARSHLYNGTYGVDFEAVLRLPGIDFGTFHMYFEPWGESVASRFAHTWISDHLRAGVKAGKPVLLEEFGVSYGDCPGITPEARRGLYREWTQFMQTEGGAGALVWMLGSNSPEVCGFRDRYTVHGPDLVDTAEAETS